MVMYMLKYVPSIKIEAKDVCTVHVKFILTQIIKIAFGMPIIQIMLR